MFALPRSHRAVLSPSGWRLALAALAVLVLLWPPMARAQACSYSVRWTEEPPYATRGPDGEVRGIDIDLTTTILKRLGCSWTLLELPWARALVELEAGRLDILAGAFRTPERERYAHFSRPIYVTSSSLYLGPAAQGKFALKQLADIIGTDFRLGAERNVSYGSTYDALRNNPDFLARLTPVNSAPGRWKMLATDRIDGLISDDMTAAMDLQRLGLRDAIVRSVAVDTTDPSRVAFSKRTVSEDVVARFDTVLRQLIEDGTYLRIKQRYMPCTPKSDPLDCDG